MALAFAGWLFRASWRVDDIKESVRLIAERVGDDEVDKRLDGVEDTCEKLASGELTVTGLPKLAELTSTGIAERLARWLDVKTAARILAHPPTGKNDAVSLEDFWAHSPSHRFIFVPTGEAWGVASVNSRIPPVATGRKTKDSKDEFIPASEWLDENRAVEQMTWAPGEPLVIHNRLIAEGGWFHRDGASCFNLYKVPEVAEGDAKDVELWLDHIGYIYPDDVEAIVRWLAHRVQRPWEKINHALVLGGGQGIGKDTLLEPVKYAIGPWNFAEIAPHHLLGRFNGFVKSVILRISEARDLGDVDRYSFYERLKLFTAAPPDVIRVDEKNTREYAVPNLCGVVLTTNHTDGIFLPPDDRRHYVAWSDCVKEDFPEKYWQTIHSWYAEGGSNNVAAYLKAYDLANFSAKAPPKQTEAWRRIVDAGRAPEDAELADAPDLLGTGEGANLVRPDAFTLSQLTAKVSGSFYDWLTDRRNRRTIPHRIEAAGYVRRELPVSERLAAVKEVN